MAIASPFTPDFRALPWQQLTSYDGPISVADIPRFFKLGRNLQECFIQLMRRSSNQTPPSDLTEMPDHSTLTSLHLSTGLMHRLSPHLLPKFPNLRQLFMHNELRYNEFRVTTANPVQTLIPFFAMSGARLEELTFGMATDADTIRACLTHTPELKVLQIDRVANDALLKFLSFPPEDEVPLVPKLEVLRFSGNMDFCLKNVIDIIRARWAQSEDEIQHKQLKSVAILPWNKHTLDPQAKKDLLAFNKQGFTVSIRSLDRSAFKSCMPLSCRLP
ncbi:hypothetical protein NLJ89_g10593 [Agrocybe chaxingu]|uniref:Uncharacterized protein n=1 Tax=Agrocybe chaxingu TaxID=84603 RepID=A0A9W8JTY5_9AGAR|nr:hypothetical protein NLJ89_g10593 [Agrocybe chaxingu]